MVTTLFSVMFQLDLNWLINSIPMMIIYAFLHDTLLLSFSNKLCLDQGFQQWRHLPLLDTAQGRGLTSAQQGAYNTHFFSQDDTRGVILHTGDIWKRSGIERACLNRHLMLHLRKRFPKAWRAVKPNQTGQTNIKLDAEGENLTSYPIRASPGNKMRINIICKRWEDRQDHELRIRGKVNIQATT